MDDLELSLGKFRDDIAGMTTMHLTKDEIFYPLSIEMPVDHITVVLGCSPYIALRSGSTSITLSHVQRIRRSVEGGRKSYAITCNDYTSEVPAPIEYRLSCME